MNKQKGFTLIELLLVLAIIGIISAIAIPALLGQRESARNRSTASNASNVAGAVQVALDIVEGQPLGSRTAVDLDPAASSETAVLTIMAARPEYAISKNPFNQSVPAYVFNVGPATVAGSVNLLPTLINGQNVVVITYGTSLKGTFVPNTLPKAPESSMAI